MSFKKVASQISSKENISIQEANKRLAGHTFKVMKKHGMSTKHGIPKGVFKKKAFSQHHSTMRSVGAMM